MRAIWWRRSQKGNWEINYAAYCVYGNNDGERLGLKQMFQEIYVPPLELNLDTKKIVLMHEPDNLKAIEQSGYYDVIVYGHTMQ